MILGMDMDNVSTSHTHTQTIVHIFVEFSFPFDFVVFTLRATLHHAISHLTTHISHRSSWLGFDIIRSWTFSVYPPVLFLIFSSSCFDLYCFLLLPLLLCCFSVVILMEVGISLVCLLVFIYIFLFFSVK